MFIVDGFLHTDYSGMLAAQELPTVQQVIDLSTSAFDDFFATKPSTKLSRTDAVTHDDIGAIMFTSGTTGHPKGVLVRGGAMIAIQRVGRCTTWIGDPYLIVNPYFHLRIQWRHRHVPLVWATNIPFPA